MEKFIKLSRRYLAVFFGRRYFSPFDFRFGFLFNSIQNSDKNILFDSQLMSIFLEITQQFIDDVRSSITSIEDIGCFKSNIINLERRVTELYLSNSNNKDTLPISKMIYHQLISYYNNLIYPQLSGLLNESYLRIRRQNLEVLNAGPIENMRLYIGEGISNYNDSFIKHSFFDYFFRIRNNRYELYRSLLLNFDYQFNTALKVLNLNSNDKRYHDILKNKNVLLIGPSNSVNLNEELINSIDLVVLLNHGGYANTYSFLKENKNIPVISYYSGGRLRMLNNDNIDEIVQDTIFTVWSERNIRLKFPKLHKSKVKGLRNHDSLIEFGRWNFALYVILDLLIYEPKTIYVTGINLFIEEDISNLYLNYYDANSKDKQNIKSICIHNPYEQFNLFNELYLNKRIQPDSALKNLLELGVHGYLRKLFINLSLHQN